MHTGALVEDSVLMDNVDVGRQVKVRRAIPDKNVRVPAGDTIGYDLERDRDRGYAVASNGIVAVQGREEINAMFDSLEDQMKAEDIEGSPKERMMRYAVIGAVSLVVIVAIVLATEFLK